MLAKFLKKIKKNSKILILTHSGADVDALASAAVIQNAFSHSFKIEIGIPSHISLNAKALAENLKITYTINPQDIELFDALILVDFNAWKMLSNLENKVKEFKKPILLIDHHSKTTDSITKNSLIDSKAVATVELLFNELKKEKITVSQKIAECIAAGIIADSAGFLVADSNTFEIMAETLKIAKKPFNEIFSLFQVIEDFSQKIAKLKAARRVRIFKINDFIIATTTVGCFEAEAASALSRLGADIAFAGDSDNGKLRISARAAPSFVKKNNFDLARDVFEPLEKTINGSGGGHPGAAAFNGTADSAEPALQNCVELIQSFLKKKFGHADKKEYD